MKSNIAWEKQIFRHDAGEVTRGQCLLDVLITDDNKDQIKIWKNKTNMFRKFQYWYCFICIGSWFYVVTKK